MKAHLTIAFIVVLGLIACSTAMPAKKRMAYYKRNAQYYAGPKRMMYVQYVQPAERMNVRRSTQATAALVAGDTVATRTYLDDCVPGVHAHVDHSADTASANVGLTPIAGEASEGVTLNIAADSQTLQQEQHDEDLLASVGAHGATSIAEAYPAPPADEPQAATHQTVGIELGFSAGVEGEAAPVADTNPALNEVAQTVVDVETPAVVSDAVAPESVPEPAVVAEEPVPEPAPAYLPSDDEAKVPREYNFEVAAGVENTANVASAPAEEPAAVPVTSVAAAIDTTNTAAVATEDTADVAVETPTKTEVTIKLPAAAAAPAPAPAPAPIASPARRYFPAQKKKVFVQLEQSAADGSADEDEEHGVAVLPDAEEDDAEEEDTYLVPVAKPTRRTAVKRTGVKTKANCVSCKAAAQPKPLPAGTFFPIDFGGTSGGAIAIANAFSTGEGGSATSHAIAYGSPEAVRARVRPPSRRH